MELQSNIAYLWKKNYNDVGAHLDFRQENDNNVNTRSENRRRKHNVVTTLWQRYPTSWPKYNQNFTLLQRRVPVGTQEYQV